MEDLFSVFPVEKSMGYIIHILDTELSSSLRKRFKENGYDITPEQWSVLNKLWEEDGIHQSMLAKKSRKNRHNMTRILNILEKAGYVKKVPDKKDKRLLIVHLTKEGLDLKKNLIKIVTGTLMDAFYGISEEDIKKLKKTHLKILANLGYNTSSLG